MPFACLDSCFHPPIKPHHLNQPHPAAHFALPIFQKSFHPLGASPPALMATWKLLFRCLPASRTFKLSLEVVGAFLLVLVPLSFRISGKVLSATLYPARSKIERPSSGMDQRTRLEHEPGEIQPGRKPSGLHLHHRLSSLLRPSETRQLPTPTPTCFPSKKILVSISRGGRWSPHPNMTSKTPGGIQKAHECPRA